MKEKNDEENEQTSDPLPQPASALPEEPQELESAIRKVSEKKPEIIQEFMAMMGTARMANPLYQKMESSHITQLLELAASHDERSYNIENNTFIRSSRKKEQLPLFLRSISCCDPIVWVYYV
jgi:hypothetical protein